jgi:hypothetical protein
MGVSREKSIEDGGELGRESIREYLAAMHRQADALRSVMDCPDRGPILPISLQPECGMCGEQTECKAGKGQIPGRVTLDDCLHCVATQNVLSGG